ncbi:unnamed protein product [Strongylus vulgaris]|uniref:Uncharacterized protein n=1 Tax=Strongylus vulgaris TaxID=40348 RepID=A0A3P7JWX1_STRVU|nr:unnamed protein product [Strongylus vulgaris]
MPKQTVSTLDDIMERAVRKYFTILARLEPSVSLDTTTIHFDQPVWDDAKLREELLDSEEEFALDATPPSLREDSLIVDEIISEATHTTDYNPIDHGRKDEMISGWSSDESKLIENLRGRLFSDASHFF